MRLQCALRFCIAALIVIIAIIVVIVRIYVPGKELLAPRTAATHSRPSRSHSALHVSKNNHSLVVTEGGVVYTFGTQHGSFENHDALLPEKIDALPLRYLGISSYAASDCHSLAVTEGGMVLSWGYDTGQLGRPRKGRIQQEISFTPSKGKGRIQEISFIPFLERVSSVAASLHTSCAVTTDGKLFVRGKHSSQSWQFFRAPKLVEALRDHFFIAVSTDREHVVAATRDGRVIGMDLVMVLSPERLFAQYA